MSRLIDADALDSTMYEAWMNCEITNEEWFHFREMLKDEPTAEPQRMSGRWIPQGWNDTYCKCSCCDAVYVTAEIPYNFCLYWYRMCSECGYERDDDNIDMDTNFCPDCGAWMEGAEDDA